MSHDFELLVPTQKSLEIQVDPKDVPHVLGSVTLIRRDGTVIGPIILKGPETVWTSPQKTLTLRAHEHQVRGEGLIQIMQKTTDIQRVQVVPHANLEDTQVIKNSVAQTLLKGNKKPIDSKNIGDNVILVGNEGVFLVNVNDKTDGNIKLPSKKDAGVRDNTLATDNILNLARGYTLINTAV